MSTGATVGNDYPGPTLRVRGRNGRMIRTLSNVERGAEAARLRSLGYSFQQIADALGYGHKSNAKKAVDRAMADVPVESVERLRSRQDMLIERLLTEAIAVLERDHVAHSQGRIVYAGCPGPGHPGHFEYGTRTNRDGDPIGCQGEPVLDDGPKLQAITVARSLAERQAKLHGLDAPVRTAIEGDELVIRIKGVDTDQV